MGGATLLVSMAGVNPLSTVALVLAILSGICVVLGVGLVIFDVASGRERARSSPKPSAPPTELEQAGFQATGLATMDASRWVPAVILKLACDGELAIIDRRPRDLRTSGVWDPPVLWVKATSDRGAVDLLRSAIAPDRGAQVQLIRTDEVALRLGELTARDLGPTFRPRTIIDTEAGDGSLEGSSIALCGWGRAAMNYSPTRSYVSPVSSSAHR
ncbi:hypothetical protein ACFQ58_04895 [Agromyces sp. NPDC056523]|uniref:hypothetical protein n=1 Tax=Agromyces sp. NPDC056523 TaxID=3345850 RepID=UPI00367259C9